MTLPLIKGGWQLAGGHGPVTPDAALADMFAYADAGITTFDCADIYTGVEERIGVFLKQWTAKRGRDAPRIRVHTKCVPDLGMLATLTKGDLEHTIDRSLSRLGVERLDLVQFHWWDYTVPGCAAAAQHLQALQRAGKIERLGSTNFDVMHLDALAAAGVTMASQQVQYSLLDRRPARGMTAWTTAHGATLYCYGALAGGFLHERWLGAADPATLENRSLVKYRLIIEEFGGWERFQHLLATLHTIAEAHDTTIGAVAIRWVLDQPGVTAAIVGARNATHLPATVAAASLALSAADHAQLAAIVADAPGPAGDCYTLERDREGRHGSIMRYNLNDTPTH